jgi:hypothetical protein
MSENTPISSNPATWAEGCEVVRLAYQRLLSARDEREKLIALLIRGAVTAAFCHRVIFIKGNSSNTRQPGTDEQGRADTRYLEAKARSIEASTVPAQSALVKAMELGDRESVERAVANLVFQCQEQTQVNWYQSQPDQTYRALTKLSLGRTREALELELGLAMKR